MSGETLENVIEREIVIMRVEQESNKKIYYAFADMLANQEQSGLDHIDYINVSRNRFEYIMALSKRVMSDRKIRILDVGRSFLSYLLCDYYENVMTLGLPNANKGYGHEYIPIESKTTGPKGHIVFNLNDAQFISCIDGVGEFDLIVFSEVLEHLYTAPELVFHLLKNHLSDRGIIICSTPNAVALQKRMRFIKGINPFDRIRIIHTNPGHFREYTKEEIIEIGTTAGLEVLQHFFDNFSKRKFKLLPRCKNDILNFICHCHKPFSRFQIIVFKKAVAASKCNSE